MMPPKAHPDYAKARKEAAAILRQVRGSDLASCSEFGGWIHMLMPDRLAVQRLHIDMLLSLGHADEASAVIERAMAARPDSLCLRLRRIRCLLSLGRMHEAAAEALFLAQARPQHVASLTAAAEAMTAVGQHRRAREYLLRAIERGSVPAVCTPSMADRLVDAGLSTAAFNVVQRLPDPPVWLRARVLAACERLCDALALLESDQALRDRDDRTHVLRLQLLARIGHVRRISEHAARGGGDEHAVVAGECLLAAGNFAGSLHALRHRLAAGGSLGQRARSTAIAALASMGRCRAARRLASFTQRMHDQKPSRDAVAAAWLRAFRGRLIALNMTGRRHGCDPATSMLQPLAHRAMECFNRALDGDFQDTFVRDHVVRMRDCCLAVVGGHAAQSQASAFNEPRLHQPDRRATLAPGPAEHVQRPDFAVPLRKAA